VARQILHRSEHESREREPLQSHPSEQFDIRIESCERDKETDARRYRGDKISRTAQPHKILDPKAGPLIAVKLNILTRKSLGGLQTDLDSRVLRTDGTPLPGVYAAGEVAGFGGGGVHGYRSLEGTFLGGCLFSGRTAGRAAAKAVS